MTSKDKALTASLEKEISRRRTFAIISHPDAGKTTLTEKLLLFGGAINEAGAVRAKRAKKFTTSDWMELEKQRGISVSSSVMKFNYRDSEINLIDTPGHEDFSEDTYRTLTAVDSALMLIDCANGVEKQTKKLFEVCALRKTPIMTFINKLDRNGRNPLELMEEIEQVLGIATYPITWPVGMGDLFKGVYHRHQKAFISYNREQEVAEILPLGSEGARSPLLRARVGDELCDILIDEIDLLDGAGDAFDQKAYLAGSLAPVFFGSALNNFGVAILLDNICELAPGPLARATKERLVEPDENKFTAFIFKIQANMDPAHRDRVAFMRICSGRFERGMKAYHVRGERSQRLGRPTQFMAQDRSLVDEAFAGDIVGIHDPGVYKIGDTLTEGEKLEFMDIPVFAPEHFVRVDLKDPLKSKQLKKGLDQLSEEGAVQVFRPQNSNDQYLGVVGELQIDVVKYRINAEYGVNINMVPLAFSAARWVQSDDEKALATFLREQSNNVCFDSHGQPTLLLDHDWRLKFHQERHPKIVFKSFSEA